MKKKDDRNEEMYRQVRALKRYARQLKFLAEDLNPVGQPIPEILSYPPPLDLNDDEQEDVNFQR